MSHRAGGARQRRSVRPRAVRARAASPAASASSISQPASSPTWRVTRRGPRSLSGCSSFAGRRIMAGCPGRSTALAMMVAAASAASRGLRQHGDGIGNAERKTAAVASAGRHAPRGIIGVDDHGPHHAAAIRPIHQAHAKLFAARKMERDIAAIIDIGAIEPRRLDHGAENFFRDRTRHRRHRRDETICRKWRDRRMHPPRDDALSARNA